MASSSHFVKTDTVLDRILARKVDDLAALRRRLPDVETRLKHAAADAGPPRDFVSALRAGANIALIAEVKHASPSKGILIEPFDPLALGELYAKNGASAISVLTDEPFFQGHLDHLCAVRAAVNVPVLRKDFIIEPLQVWEARAAGADAVLLIVAALADAQLSDLLALIGSLRMAALVEVHSEAELERALKLGASLIGVNNRDLRTFSEDLNTTARVARGLPPQITLVAESAIRSPDDVASMGALGAHAVLVGEGLITAGDIAAAVRAFSSQSRGGSGQS